MRTRKSKSRRSVLGSRERGGRLLLHSQGAILGPQIAFQRLKHDRKLLRPPSLKSQLRKSMHSETSADHQLETIIGKFAELDWRMIDATCACFLAVTLGVPTFIARWLLEYKFHNHELLRVSLRTLAQQAEFQVGLDEAEIAAIREHPAPLYVYCKREDMANTRLVFSPLIVQLGTMLSIQSRVVFRDKTRLQWNFHSAVQAFRARAREAIEPDGEEFPIGSLARDHLGNAGRYWYDDLRNGRVKFENFESRTSTQLRVLLDLALLVAGGDRRRPLPWTMEDLTYSTKERRQEMLARLGDLLADGLEAPPALRQARYQRVLTGSNFRPDGTPLYDAVDVWWKWLVTRLKAAERKGGSGAGAYRALAQQTLLELNSTNYVSEKIALMAAQADLPTLDVEQLLVERSFLRLRRSNLQRL